MRRIGSIPLLVLLVLADLGAAAAGDLIRYRRADGSIGFAGSETSVPAGARILTRGRTSEPATSGSDRAAPTVAELISQVRQRCEARWARDADLFERCIALQTRGAFRYRDALLEHAPGTVGHALVRGCREKAEPRRSPDYEKLATCARDARRGWVERHGGDPAGLADALSEPPAAPARDAQAERLEQLRQAQARAARELAIGRQRWAPRYRKAETDLARAEERTREIVEKMRRRGCRTDTLACGGLAPKLERAREIEAQKREYLNSGIVNECRRAGCQPGWLR